jgi:hypothetical protein
MSVSQTAESNFWRGIRIAREAREFFRRARMLEWGPARIPQTPVSFTQRITIEGEGTRPESLEIAVSFRVYEPINSFRLTLARRFTEALPLLQARSLLSFLLLKPTVIMGYENLLYGIIKKRNNFLLEGRSQALPSLKQQGPTRLHAYASHQFHTRLKPSCRKHIELITTYLEMQNDPIRLEKEALCLNPR